MQNTVASKILRTEERECDGASYVYTLSTTRGQRVASFGLTLYSIGICMTDSDGNVTHSSLDEIFSESKKAIRFFNRLVDNLATPIDLPYILEDELR
jgi:hypothetical protein